MLKLTDRQKNILGIIREIGKAKNQDISKVLKDVSRVTVVRDLGFLLKNNLIIKKGKGRSVYYEEKTKYKFLEYLDLEDYFQQEADQREVGFKSFNFEIFNSIKDIFQEQELKELNILNSEYQSRIQSLSSGVLKKELERLTIELSWKSSRIEGNTYSLIDTEILIKENKEAEGHKKEEAIMILNHKKALDYILSKKSDFKRLTLGKIESIHRLIVDELDVSTGIRNMPVGIIGTQYKPLDNEYQIKEAIEKMIKTINNMESVFSKAFFAITVLSYIQPFEDGNKRTARLLGNALLLAYNICPLSFRSVNESDYKKSLVVFFEQNNLRSFKDLFIEQFKFSVGNYFLKRI